MATKLKFLKNREQRRAVNSAQLIKILMIKEEIHRWPIARDADEWCAGKQQEARRGLRLTLPTRRAKGRTLRGGELSAGERRGVKVKKRKESLLEGSQR